MTSITFEFFHKAVLALLLCSQAAGQVSQCASAAAPQLRFVAQLSVRGCALFVHDTRASDGPHLAVEPLMCVTDSLEGLLPRLDPVTQQLYVSVPVVMRDAGMLAEAERQLRHLSPRSVSFATVNKINISVDIGSVFRSVELIWSPVEEVAFLRMYQKVNLFRILRSLNTSAPDVFNTVVLSTSINQNGTCQSISNRLMIQNQSFFSPQIIRRRYSRMPLCRQLRFIRSVKLENCTARVHQRLDIKGHFLIEPLLCHNITSLSSESVRYDYSRDKYYLKLDLVLQDEATPDAVRTQLSDLSPRSVEFMQLWLAESSVSSALSARFEIGPLMVSADWRSAQLRVFCRSEGQCRLLRREMTSEPANLWRHVMWKMTALSPMLCHVKSEKAVYSWRMKERLGSTNVLCLPSSSNTETDLSVSSSRWHHGRCFVKIQQRVRGTVSFQRTWAEYEAGFGDETDFWIGLSAIHSLSAGGATLRVEMKLWNGTELHAEYAGFQVGDASTKYVMTYREMLKNRSSVGRDSLNYHKGMRFSTMDSDNDGRGGVSCSNKHGGKGGWWFNECSLFNPNGIFPSRESTYEKYMSLYTRSGTKSLRSVRLMLQI